VPGLRLTLLRISLLLALAATLGGCSIFEGMQQARWQRWHERNMAALAAADYPDALPTFDDDVPRKLREDIKPLYMEWSEALMAQAGAQQALQAQSLDTVTVLSRTVDVILARNHVALDALRGRIKEVLSAQREKQQAYEAAQAAAAALPERLKAKWEEVWPGHGLSFEVMPLALEQLQAPPAQELAPSEIQRYQRMAQIAADGHAARERLQEQITADVAEIERISGLDLLNTPLEDLPEPKGAYNREKQAAAIARLKLARLVNNNLEDALAWLPSPELASQDWMDPASDGPATEGAATEDAEAPAAEGVDPAGAADTAPAVE
jgi:hypothetical protein